jgi:hypothetical protein
MSGNHCGTPATDRVNLVEVTYSSAHPGWVRRRAGLPSVGGGTAQGSLPAAGPREKGAASISGRDQQL